MTTIIAWNFGCRAQGVGGVGIWLEDTTRVEVSTLKNVRFAVNLNKKCKVCAQCDECTEKKLQSGEKFLLTADAMKWEFNAKNRLCGEWKFFTALKFFSLH